MRHDTSDVVGDGAQGRGRGGQDLLRNRPIGAIETVRPSITIQNEAACKNRGLGEAVIGQIIVARQQAGSVAAGADDRPSSIDVGGDPTEHHDLADLIRTTVLEWTSRDEQVWG